jgi:superoxide dismutase, Fe-Mn family
MAFTLPDLPYAKDAFGKLLSAESFDYHHGKHHKAYVDKTNELVAADDKLSGKSLSEVILAAKEGGDKKLFNNSAQLWNHSFFWQCLSPDGGKPEGELEAMIDYSFGSVADMSKAFTDEAVAHFGSGWAWLVLDGDKLKITSLHDADTPAAHGMAPLLTIDVWEHAYYIDYRNARPDYVAKLLEKAINWEFVAQNVDGRGVGRADQKA